MSRKILAFAVKLAVTVGLFVLLFRPQTFWLRPDFWGDTITLRGLLHEIRSVETHNLAFWMSFAALVRLGGILCGVVRWRLLLRGQGIDIPFGYAAQSWFVGRAIGMFLPGTIGLDGYRLYDSIRYTGEATRCTTVIAVEKLTGFIALTLLVFITFPMGYGVLHFRWPVVALCMTVFGVFVIVSLLLLLYPRVIRVLVAVIPAPPRIQSKLDKIGAAVAAYGGNRSLLLWAVFYGILVHAAICLMFFGVMSAIRAENTTVFDIFFVSPLMIWGTVLGPSVGGEGIREIVWTTFLGAKSGTTKAFLIGHLGWWAGDVPPFLIGLAVFLIRKRPSKEEMQQELAKARAAAAREPDFALPAERVRAYRRNLVNCALAGILAGVLAGACCGLAESYWVVRSLPGLSEFRIYPWAVVWYGLLFSGAGLGAAAALAFLYLLRDRFPRPQFTFSLSLGTSIAAGALIIGAFRISRDILEGHRMSLTQLAALVAAAGCVGAVSAAVALLATWRFAGTRKAGAIAGVGAYALALAGAFILSGTSGRGASIAPFAPKSQTAGPNILFIGLDALRADALRMYASDAEASTPCLEAFARDAVRFDRAFAQASWTKPSFATLFTGLYPESHTATSKTAALPLNVVTLAELLLDAGYYTQGFANNPHITALFHFDQGFVSYVDLKPNLYFAASPSASKLSLYEVLRRVRQKLNEKVLGGRLVVTDFYQPAEEVTRVALEWLDQGPRLSEAPFFLFLHYMDAHDPFMDWRQPGVGYARVRMEHPDPKTFLEPMTEAYREEVQHLDRHLGELFEGLRARGIYDDALIILTADHGEEFYDHEGWWHGQTLYDEVVRVPLLIKLPRNAQAGAVDRTFARHIDIAPTVLSLAGVEQPEAMPGTPLVREDGSLAPREVAFVYAENDFDGNDLQAVRTEDAKVIRANADNMRNLAPIEFYDLTEDAAEQNNRAGKGDARESALLRILEEMQAFIREHAAEPSLKDALPQDIEDQMRSIGYL